MRPRILLISMADWFGPTRLPRELRKVGFEVGILADPAGLLAKSRHVDYRFDLWPDLVRLGVLEPVLRAIMQFAPRLLVRRDRRTSTAQHREVLGGRPRTGRALEGDDPADGA